MKKMLGIALIILFGLAELSFGQTAKDAFKSLKNVEAMVETGVSYQDYPQVITDTQTAVNLFLESNEAMNNPQIAKKITMAMDYYIVAKKIWDIKFNCNNDFVMEAIGINNNCGREIKRLYPKSRAEMLPGNLGPFYVVSNILRNIFNDASKEIKEASKILKID